jgi:hypothetical protein
MAATYELEGHGQWTVHQRNPDTIVLRPADSNLEYQGKGFLYVNREAFKRGSEQLCLVVQGPTTGEYQIPCVGCKESITFCWPDQSSLMCPECKANPTRQCVGPKSVSAPKHETTRALKREQMKLF